MATRRKILLMAGLALGILWLLTGRDADTPDSESSEALSGLAPAAPKAPTPAPADRNSLQPDELGPSQGVVYGRVTTHDDTVFEGRLRWGRGEEAFWSESFNGRKKENPWRALVDPARLPTERIPISFFGFDIAHRTRALDLARPFMARFGDIAKIEARGLRDVRVTLKNGTVVDLDRFSAGDFDDTIRVWDGEHGVVDLDSAWIRTIEFLPTPTTVVAPRRLQGTVRTPHGDFTGDIQWDREKGVATDELVGTTPEGPLSLRLDSIDSIERLPGDACLVTLRSGRELTLFGARGVGPGSRGCYVNDRRYGRVLVPWQELERVDFRLGDGGPGYADFPPGQALLGVVTTREGRRVAGRLVYDFDESETTETFDAPAQGVNYSIPFGLISAIALGGDESDSADSATVTLVGGEELKLERAGDLGPQNAGVLVFVGEHPRPEYVAWGDVERIDFKSPPQGEIRAR